MAQEKASTLGFIVRDDKESARLSTDSVYAGIKVMDNIPIDSYAEMSFGTISGTVVPQSEGTGRIKNTYSIYGRVNAGESISKSGSRAFIPRALIKNMEESELRLEALYTGKAVEKMATEVGEVLIAKTEADSAKETEMSTGLFKKELSIPAAVKDVAVERPLPTLGAIDTTLEERAVVFPKTLMRTLAPPEAVNPPQAVEEKETQKFTLKGPFGQIKLTCRNIYFSDPMIIVRYGLDQGFSYTPPAGPVLMLEDTYPVVFTGIEFDMEDIDAHLQLFVLAKETKKE